MSWLTKIVKIFVYDAIGQLSYIQGDSWKLIFSIVSEGYRRYLALCLTLSVSQLVSPLVS